MSPEDDHGGSVGSQGRKQEGGECWCPPKGPRVTVFGEGLGEATP